MAWYWIVLLIVFANWVVPAVVTAIYFGWLCFVSKDIKFEGLAGIYVGKFRIPVFRFRLVSKYSWYARAWAGWAGFSMFLSFIYRDRRGSYDDDFVEEIMVHERRHCIDQLMFGLMQWVIYGLDWLRLKIFTSLSPYYDNIWERRARAEVARWDDLGRPEWFDFGERL